jgi:hypothetical protein
MFTCPSTGKTDEDVEQVKELVLKNRRNKNTTNSVAEFYWGQFRASDRQQTCVSQVDPKVMPPPLPLPRE